MTLVEVVAGLALLGSLLVAVLLARAGYTRQGARANRRIEAVAAADTLLSAWHSDPGTLPVESSGAVAGDGQLAWRTRIVESPDAEALGASVVRLEMLDQRAPAAPVLATVEFLVGPESHHPASLTGPSGASSVPNSKARAAPRRGHKTRSK